MERVRRRRRPSTMAGRSSASSDSRSVGVPRDPEDDYPDLAELEQAPSASNPPAYDPLDPTVADGAEGEPMSPAEILFNRGDDGKSKATKSQKEMRLRMVSRAMLRGVDEQTMANTFKVSVGQIKKDVREVRELMAKQVAELDINSLLGEQMAFYKDVQSTALRLASKTKVTDGVRLAALRTAMTSNADKSRLLKLAGVFDALPFVSDKTEDKSDIETLSELTKAIMAMDLENDEMSQEDLEVMQSLREDGDEGNLDDDDVRLI